MNIEEKYSWLANLESAEAKQNVQLARNQFQEQGAFVLPNFITDEALARCVEEARHQEDQAFTTDDKHTAYLKPTDSSLSPDSIVNLHMRTQVASIAFDELPRDSTLANLYKDPVLLQFVSEVVQKKLYLSDDPLGCCSINVFRPGYHHSFHFDESEFSVTLMLQESEDTETGLFQYTNPLRRSRSSSDFACSSVANTIGAYDELSPDSFAESSSNTAAPCLHTLNFRPGALSIFSGSRSLHRVTKVKGSCSRLVAVLTYSTKPGFRNSPQVQKLFWGRSVE